MSKKKVLTAAEATEQSARGIDPNEVIYSLCNEDVFTVLTAFNEAQEREDKPPLVLAEGDIEHLAKHLDLDWWDQIFYMLEELAAEREEGD